MRACARSLLVAVVVGLVGAFNLDAEVVGLFLAEPGELRADAAEVQAGHFLVEILG